jgi:hypothetical protein
MSVVLISAGLVIGFFRALGLPGPAPSGPGMGRSGFFLGMRNNAWAVVLTISSFAYPPSVALRLTSGGWELGNRMSAFVFLGVGLVVAVGAAKVLITPDPGRIRVAVVSVCLAIVLIGGVIAELPPDLVAQPYRPAADGTSIEPMGIATARWTRDWLGEGWRFASDRANRLLLATHGVQRIVTKEQDGVELGKVLFDATYSDEDKNLVRTGAPSFFLIDLRLPLRRPLWGYYFDAGEDAELHASLPLGLDLVKFDDSLKVGRVYDNGYELIYDVRNLIDEDPLNAPPPSNGDAKINSAATVGRTFRMGDQAGDDAAVPGPAAPQGVDPARNKLPSRIDSSMANDGVHSRVRVNYDAGVLHHVTQ